MPVVPLLLWALVGTLLLIALSWRAFRRPRSHGFFRFFALESILWLVLLNASVWFRRPLAPLQLLSWLLLVVSGGLALHGFHLLYHRGQPSAPEAGSPLFLIENTAALVTTGAYRFIRHPLYTSLLCFSWGVALKSLTALSGCLAVLATVFLIATAKSEEAENIARFGEAYRVYMAHTHLLIPFLL